MSISIQRVGEMYEASVRPPHGEGRAWDTPHPLALDQLIDAVFLIAGIDTIATAIDAAGGVDQHAVSHIVGDGRVAWCRIGDRLQEHTGSHHRGASRGTP